ncbi:DeoR family transcriptional regulator [Roseovarius sp.]|uniref:DeoR family transcriptional regulator n=1 Tax=Roseovarius sp. TaxID=1486281 RepID=UPI003565D390
MQLKLPTKKESRLNQLQDAVARSGSLHIRDAAELLEVSEMTIRRDIRDVKDKFQFLGGHIVFSDDTLRRSPYNLAQAGELNETAKHAACAACIPLLQSEQTLFVDCGTTLPHLVHLAPDDMKLTIICYALNIADIVVRKSNVKLVVLGGVYNPATASFYPVKEDATLDSFAINYAFLSAAGVDDRLGVTCVTFKEASLKRAAMARAQKRILVVDNSKFGQVKPATFAKLEDFDLIATEDGISPPNGVA